MVFFELIEKNNQECNFTDSIRNSEFIEKINLKPLVNKSPTKRYNNLLLCILFYLTIVYTSLSPLSIILVFSGSFTY